MQDKQNEIENTSEILKRIYKLFQISYLDKVQINPVCSVYEDNLRI